MDKYQGQQNDYILLSLVRSRAVGHVRDVRRLVVAMSRARLGLYVFGRRELFENCYELQPTFKQLLARPDALQLLPGEKYEVSAGVAPCGVGGGGPTGPAARLGSSLACEGLGVDRELVLHHAVAQPLVTPSACMAVLQCSSANGHGCVVFPPHAG